MDTGVSASAFPKSIDFAVHMKMTKLSSQTFTLEGALKPHFSMIQNRRVKLYIKHGLQKVSDHS